MILYLCIAFGIGFMTCAFFSMRATDKAYQEGVKSSCDDMDFLQARNRELANKLSEVQNV